MRGEAVGDASKQHYLSNIGQFLTIVKILEGDQREKYLILIWGMGGEVTWDNSTQKHLTIYKNMPDSGSCAKQGRDLLFRGQFHSQAQIKIQMQAPVKPLPPPKALGAL